MPTTFVLDANVLYSARLRDLWLQLAATGVARIAWTEAIETEWTNALERKRPDLRDLIARTTSTMRSHFAECYLTEVDLPPLGANLPDADDVHVVRAALAVAGAIVTFNLADFPEEVLSPLNVEVLTPDDALYGIAIHDEEGMLAAAHAIRARLKAPPISAATFATGFTASGCPKFSAWLRQRQSRF